jgi:hypothetical protein
MKFTRSPNSTFKIKPRHRLFFFLLLFVWVLWSLRPYSRMVCPEGHIELSPMVMPGQSLILYARGSFSDYKKGDLVWYASPKNSPPRLGRLLASEGDVITVKEGQVFCGEQKCEFILGLPPSLNLDFPALKAGQVMVIHDQQSTPFEDSLTLGPLEATNTSILGKLFLFASPAEPSSNQP